MKERLWKHHTEKVQSFTIKESKLMLQYCPHYENEECVGDDLTFELINIKILLVKKWEMNKSIYIQIN